MSIGGIKFNDPSSTQKFDLNNDGKVTMRELKKIASSDGNRRDLSAQDLQSVGVTDVGIQNQVIEAFNKKHFSLPNLFSFPSGNQNSTTPTPNTNPTNRGSDGPGDTSGADTWKDSMVNLTDPSQTARANTREFRERELTDPASKSLYESLGSNKEIGSYLSQIAESHPESVAQISQTLSNYLTNPPSEGALFADEKQRDEYVKNVLRDIAYPTDVFQGNNGTCGATAIQVKLALEDPTKYAEMATSLADGREFNGIQPNRNFQQNGIDNRNTSAQIIQNAFMDYANGEKQWGSRDIDRTVKDSEGNVTKQGIDGGLTQPQIEKLQENLFGSTNVVRNSESSNDDSQRLQQIDQSLTNGSSVPFSVFGPDGKGNMVGHEMLILDKLEDGSYKIFTWGEERTMSPEDLIRFLKDAQINNA